MKDMMQNKFQTLSFTTEMYENARGDLSQIYQVIDTRCILCYIVFIRSKAEIPTAEGHCVDVGAEMGYREFVSYEGFTCARCAAFISMWLCYQLLSEIYVNGVFLS